MNALVPLLNVAQVSLYRFFQLVNMYRGFTVSTQVPIDDSIAPISTNPTEAVSTIAGWAAIIGGGIAMVLIAAGGYKILTSSGDANKIKDGTDQIQNAILGFLLVLLSVTIIRIIFGVMGITDITNITI